MIAITITRKPLSEGTVAANVLKHGCGAINIDRSRIAAAPGDEVSNHSRGSSSAVSKGIYGDSAAQQTHQTQGQRLGRWPSNVILQHTPQCRPSEESCSPGCPAGDLTLQGVEGGMHSACGKKSMHIQREGYASSSYTITGNIEVFRYGDVSTSAARFFKQVQEMP
jgi:hypothetical protein